MNTKVLDTEQYEHVYVVGDLHGEITQLRKVLAEALFNKETDLLISVGDLIDRGEDSLECLRLLNEPWFECVMGNHEKMAYDALETGDYLHWLQNGGEWYLDLADPAEADALIRQAGKLPLIIEVNQYDIKTVICHADFPYDTYTRDTTGIEEHLLWSRERIKEEEASRIEGAELFLFGHTPLKEPLTIENQMYIDTAACFGNKLTLVELI